MYFCFSRSLIVTVVLFGHVSLPVCTSLLSSAVFYLHTALSNNNSLNLLPSLLESALKSANLTKTVCFEHIKDVARGIFNFEEWALSMIDAFGKPKANILGGNSMWLGSYKECLNIRKRSISGKYCWLNLNVNYKKQSYKLSDIGICVPDSCDENHLKIIFQIIKKLDWLKKVELTAKIDCIYNPLDNLHKDVTALIAIAICCVLFIFVAVGTILDFFSKTKKLDNCNERQLNELEKQETKKSACFNIFLYFSILSNFKKLFYLETSASTFSELNALKVIAALMIIYAHTFVGLFVIVNNPEESGLEFGSWLSQFTFQVYMVDIFFLVTGFLTLNGVLTKSFQIRENINTFKFIISFILPRYLKMLIVPGIIVFVSRIGLQPYFSSGPFWKITDQNCRDNWWKNVLFISNWWSMQDQCFSAWWFLSVSMQLHLLALIIIIPLIKKRYFACVFNGCAVLILSWCWLASDSYVKELPQLYPKQHSEVSAYRKSRNKYFNMFDKPFYHFGSYFIGMALSWIIFKHKDAIALTKKQLNLGWMLSSVMLFLSFFSIYLEPNNLLRSLHTAFGVTMYSLSIAWIIIICNSKDGGLVSSVLRWKCWLPLSKLSLTVYLIHPTVIDTFYLSEDEQIHYSFSIFIAMALRNWVVSYAIAVLATLIIEMPINALIDLIIKHLFASKSQHVNKMQT